MVLPGFNFHQPQIVSEAISLLAGTDNAALIADGTDLLVEMKNEE